MDISKLLTFTAKEGASDCHISAGEPPMIRMNGDLKKLDHPALTTEETHSLIYDMMSDTQRKNFEEKRECDFLLNWATSPDSASMSSSKIVGLAPSSGIFPPRSFRWKSSACLRSCDSSAIGKGADPCDRPNRVWQIDDPGLHGGLFEQHIRRPHHHNRRSDRIHPQDK